MEYGLLSVYPDAQQRLRLLSRDLVRTWAVWPLVARDFDKTKTSADEERVALDCVDRVSRISVDKTCLLLVQESGQGMYGNPMRVVLILCCKL